MASDIALSGHENLANLANRANLASLTDLADLARNGDLADAGVTIGPIAAQASKSNAAGRPQPVSASDEISVITTRAEFHALESEWTALFDRTASGRQLFQSFNWNWHWANHYLDAKTTLAVTTVRRHGELIMVWPMVVNVRSGARWLLWMGDPVSQYGDVVADDVPDQLAVMRQALDRAVMSLKIDAIEFRKVRSDAIVAALLIKQDLRITGTEEAPFTDIVKAATYATLDGRFTTKTRKNRQRQRRRLEERGALTCEQATSDAAARDAVAACMTFKRAWLSSKGLVSRALADQRVEAFFTDAATSTDHPCGVSVSTLRTGGEIADISISVTAKGTRALHMIAYGLKFEKFGPGALHLDDAFRQAFDDGITTLDFLSPRHPYKMEWADGTIAVHDYAQAFTVRGQVSIALYIDTLRNGSKSLLAALPPRARDLVAAAHATLMRRPA
jgi:CelD/BcsL family acetyltransferase involved in cellulose biosynthesis